MYLKSHSRREMPIDVTMEEPRAWVIGAEPERNIISRSTDVHSVASDGISIVVRRTACNTNDVKGVTVEMEWVLVGVSTFSKNIPIDKGLVPTLSPPGIETSTVEFLGRV